MTQINTVETTNTGAKALVDAGIFSVSIDKRVNIDSSMQEPIVRAINRLGDVEWHKELTSAERKAYEQPIVARESLKFARVQDLAEFTKRFALPGTVIFAVSPTSGLDDIGFTTVVDFSENSGSLGWNRHRAFVACARSADVKLWNKQIKQNEFADLIDDWADRVVPSGDATAANLLAMASDLEIEENRVLKVSRDSKTRLFTAQLKEGATAKTTIYPRFKVRLPLIEGRPEREVEVRLKLVKVDGSFLFELNIHDLDRLITEEFGMMAAELEKDAGVPVWQGAPPEEMSVGV